MATIVFGGAGFVGLNIVEALLARGENAVVFDATPIPARAAKAFAALPGKLRAVVGDVRKPEHVAAALSAQPVDALVYGAAVTAGEARDRAEPDLILSVNLTAYLGVLAAAREAKAGRIINLSSAGAYGAAAFRGTILDEADTPADPVSLYSITKFASERVTARMAALWGLDALSVRLSGVFGRWERKTSVRDTPSPQFQVMEAARAGCPAILPRRDDRDWIYAPDVARAVLALRDAPSLAHDLYNVSTGATFAVLDWGAALADRRPGFVCRLAGESETPTVDFYAPTDRKPLSVERIVADTGFTPQFDMAASVSDYDRWVSEEGPQAMGVL